MEALDPMSDAFWLELQDRRVADLEAERDGYRAALVEVVSDFIAYVGHPAAMESGYVRQALDMIASSEEQNDA